MIKKAGNRAVPRAVPRAAVRSGAAGLLCAAWWVFGSASLWAAQPGGPAAKPDAAVVPAAGRNAPAKPPSAQAQAPFDPTGYWVSLITENWRWRMVVPGKGEYADVPINLKAKQIADAWDPATDEAAGKQCEAYGAAVIMRNPERLHIVWQDANTLRVDTDEGMQTRLLNFVPPPPPGAPAGAPPEPLMAPHTDAPPVGRVSLLHGGSWRRPRAARAVLHRRIRRATVPSR